MTKDKILIEISKRKDELRKFGVKRIGLFGSYAKGIAKNGSDIDILVEFTEKTFDNYMDLKFYLEKLLKSKVDLVISDALKPRLKPIILKEVSYAKGL